MAKWIQATLTEYNLDSDTIITVKGDVNNLNWFDRYYYTIYIGSGGTEFEVARKKTASDFSGKGFDFEIEKSGPKNFAKIATPTGQSCYIRAVGVAGSKTVEYRTYITLKAPSIEPGGFTLSVSAVNNKVTAFPANCAVVGFSNLQLVIDKINLKYSSWIKKISFSTSFFKDIEYTENTVGAKNTSQTVTSGIVDKSGEFTLYCTVTNNFGYSSTKEITFHISDYGAPTIEFKKGGEPARTCDVNGTALEKKNAKKDWKYGFRMGSKDNPFDYLTVKPYSIINLNGDSNYFNKIVNYDSKNKAYITLTDLQTKAVAYFQSSSIDNAQINKDGIFTTWYKSGSTSSTVGYPVFNDGTTGLFMHHAYLLKIAVKDTTGKIHILTARVPSMSTTLHLRKGGRGLTVGGYSEGADDLFESYWKFECHESIEAKADDNSNEFGEKGTVKGKFVEATSKFKLNGKEVSGIGTEENQLALGDHIHGNIKSEGTTDLADAVMISGSDMKIKAAKNLPTENLTIETDTTKMLPCAGFTVSTKENESYTIPGTTTTITVGKLIHNEASTGKDGNAVKADHTHPYSREWMNDPIYIKTIQALSSALSDYL